MPAPARPSRSPEGVTLRHRSRCATRGGRRCDCRPRYQAQVYSPRDRKTLRKTFGSLAEARAWRSETHTALGRGTLRAPSRTTLEQAAEEWLRAAEADVVRTRSGDPYKPSALRGYEQALRGRLLPVLGHLKLSAITRNAVQDPTLKEGPSIVVTGSITLCHALIRGVLVDEYRFFVYPVLQGRGRLLFPDGYEWRDLSLLEAKVFRSGITYSRYAQQ